MSGYLLALVQRARGEGDALQPRTRGTFEPEGFVEVEVALSSSPVPSETLREFIAPQAAGKRELRVETTRLLERSDATTHLEERETNTIRIERSDTSTTRHERTHDHEHSETVTAATHHEHTHEHERVEALTLRERSSNTRHERSATTSYQRERQRNAITHERERIIRETRQQHRQSNQQQLPPPQPVQITIGRIDVRAIAAPAQPSSTPRLNTAKRSMPLTLDDYLRGKR